ncbi:ACT domain-containing protein [Drosera capensis]
MQLKTQKDRAHSLSITPPLSLSLSKSRFPLASRHIVSDPIPYSFCHLTLHLLDDAGGVCSSSTDSSPPVIHRLSVRKKERSSMEGFWFEKPYVDPQFESLIERIHPASVSIDNDSCKDCTLVKVDSANKHGILLDMVQILTDLDLVISKSYICSDGGWFMDVFHVTDRLGNKLMDKSLLEYIQQALCATRRNLKDVQACPGREVRPSYVPTGHQTALEMTIMDRPGLLSEVSATLAKLRCHVNAGVVWTHHARAACIFYVEDRLSGGPIIDLARQAYIQEQLQSVVEAYHQEGEKRSVRVSTPAGSLTHTERRLHQLMSDDKDYEMCSSCGSIFHNGWSNDSHGKNCDCTHINIEYCEEKRYAVVNIRSRDRPKLLFDTVCTLTDLDFEVFHAAVSSRNSIAFQEYYVRPKDGCTFISETERKRIAQCLSAAVERRASQGLRLDISAKNRVGLLSDVTRVFCKYGLSVSRAEIGTKGERAVGSFFVTDARGYKIKPETLESMKQEIDGTVQVISTPSSVSSRSPLIIGRKSAHGLDDRPGLLGLGSLLWSHLGQRFRTTLVLSDSGGAGA